MVFDFDDFHETNHRYDLLWQLKEANPGFRCTLFAVPGLGSDEFWETVPDWCELAVHGWLHPHPREAEHWTRDEAIDVMLAAPGWFVDGFKAPGWQISDGTYEAIMELGWWCADHPENDARRPDGLVVNVVGGPDHWHGHIQNDCGNGLEETFPKLLEVVRSAKSFEWVSEAVAPWVTTVAA